MLKYKFTKSILSIVCLILLTLLFIPSSIVNAASPSIINGIQWAVPSGDPIQAHGGCIIKADSYYYWFGENRNDDSTFYAVSCYRSTDLKSWEFRNNVLTMNSASELKHSNIERPKVIYNASTKKYVIWMHWENGIDYGEARAAVASCSTVDGNYTYHGSFRPLSNTGVTDHGKPGYMSRDCTLFTDTDGKAYFISAANENADLHVYLLSSDYLSIQSLVTKLWVGQSREAPAMFKRNGYYFLLTSACTGWNPNQQKYAYSKNISSGWSSLINVGDTTCFYSQTAYVLPVQSGSTASFLYMGDRWAGAWGGKVNQSTYIWLPITFPSDTSMKMDWYNTVGLDIVPNYINVLVYYRYLYNTIKINTSTGSIYGNTYNFKIKNVKSGKIADVAGYSSADNANIKQYPDNGGNNQKWMLQYDGAGYFKITNINSRKVMDVTSGSTSDGALVKQYTDNGGDNQKWMLIDTGNGYYQIKNKKSGKFLEIAGGSTSDGAALDQSAGNNGDHQKWMLLPAN